jgi:UDP-N-acetylmuramoyl-tripeptide--D-alanyl-D-alanine ligase
MSLWSLHQVAPRVGAILRGEGSIIPAALSIDTRTIQPGDCFVALRAERDGHDFAAQAVEKGATSLMVDHAMELPVPQLVVNDTLLAMQAWGQARLEAVRPRAVFGVTGSVGKTSTKELLAGAVSGWKTPGNRNNTLGLPQALATLPEGERSAVLEMGMSTPGEIKRLTEIAPLDFGIITLIGTAHMENFSEGQLGIAKAKGELIAGLRSGGKWAALASDEWCQWVAQQTWAAHATPLWIQEDGPWGWRSSKSLGPRGEAFTLLADAREIEVHLRLCGAHQVRNAALAGCIAYAAGWPLEAIAQGLSTVQPEPGRGRLHLLRKGGSLLDESYNASPDSMVATARALKDLDGGITYAVLGCIRELGATADAAHRETGAKLKAEGIQQVLVFGEQAAALAEGFGEGARAFPDFEAMRDDERGLTAIPADARILVKGSRYYRTERAVDVLLSRLG